MEPSAEKSETMAITKPTSESSFVPVILAGGSGTRFWPRSRKTRAKQVLALDGDQTLIQQTFSRLKNVAKDNDVWVITNAPLRGQISRQLPAISVDHILCEPAARNTAPACALAAFLFEKERPETVIGIFPSDHVVKDVRRFEEILRAGVSLAASGERIVVLGVPPTHPETGYGYIEQGAIVDASELPFQSIPVRRVRRFTEKPDGARAKEFLDSGNYAWNSGIFLWSARTLAAAIREHCPGLAAPLESIAAAYGTAAFNEVFARTYPECENISIDYAVLEPRSNKGEFGSEIYCLPANFEWNDLGSWNALYEHSCTEPTSADGKPNVVESKIEVAIEASGNYAYAPGKTVALLGVENLVVVVTEDAVLVTTRQRSQDVGRVTKALAEASHDECL